MMHVRIISVVIMIFALAAPANADVRVQSTLEIINGTASNWGGDATEVDYWYFTVNTPGTITIDTLSWLWDVDSDGVAHFMDTAIYLYVDDGSLDAGDLVGYNDNGPVGTDGSIDNPPGSGISIDSNLSVDLGAGDYVLAISDYILTDTDALGGVNFDGFYPAVSDGTLFEFNAPSGCTLDCTFADYQITFIGDVAKSGILIQELDAAVTGEGPGGSLANKIELAQIYLAVNDEQAACAVLNAFLNQVRAQSGKQLTIELADQLTADAEVLMSEIGCE